ncbi:MAG: CvpA family protein [Candidatus Brocadiaceae bacterium]|nr:CvpA family protein [Candidatus Brocadiaceae bacterium]
MSGTLATLLVLALLVLMSIAGYRDGLFFSTYALVRNFFGFLCAMTFSDKLAGVIAAFVSNDPMARGYFEAISFALLFGGILFLGRWLKVTYTVPSIPAIRMVDRIAGPAAGLLNAVVVTGALLIFVSMLPFARFLPGDMGRFQASPALDTGAAMLRVYDHVQGRMGGGRHFLLNDEPLETDQNLNGRADTGDGYLDVNENGKWDRGRIWQYRNFPEITLDIVPQIPAQS